jgi:hypothetical protein
MDKRLTSYYEIKTQARDIFGQRPKYEIVEKQVKAVKEKLVTNWKTQWITEEEAAYTTKRIYETDSGERVDYEGMEAYCADAGTSLKVYAGGDAVLNSKLRAGDLIDVQAGRSTAGVGEVSGCIFGHLVVENQSSSIHLTAGSLGGDIELIDSGMAAVDRIVLNAPVGEVIHRGNDPLVPAAGKLKANRLEAVALSGLTAYTNISQVAVTITGTEGDVTIYNYNDIVLDQSAISAPGTILVYSMGSIPDQVPEEPGDGEEPPTGPHYSLGGESSTDVVLDIREPFHQDEGKVITADHLEVIVRAVDETGTVTVHTKVDSLSLRTMVPCNVQIYEEDALTLRDISLLDGSFSLQAGGTINAEHVELMRNAQGNDLVLTSTSGDILLGYVNAGIYVATQEEADAIQLEKLNSALRSLDVSSLPAWMIEDQRFVDLTLSQVRFLAGPDYDRTVQALIAGISTNVDLISAAGAEVERILGLEAGLNRLNAELAEIEASSLPAWIETVDGKIVAFNLEKVAGLSEEYRADLASLLRVSIASRRGLLDPEEVEAEVGRVLDLEAGIKELNGELTRLGGDMLGNLTLADVIALSPEQRASLAESLRDRIIEVQARSEAESLLALKSESTSLGDVILSAGGVITDIDDNSAVGLVADQAALSAASGIGGIEMAVNSLLASTSNGSIDLRESDGIGELSPGLTVVEARAAHGSVTIVSEGSMDVYLAQALGEGADVQLTSLSGTIVINERGDHGESDAPAAPVEASAGVSLEAAQDIVVEGTVLGPNQLVFKAGQDFVHQGRPEAVLRSRTVTIETGLSILFAGTIEAVDQVILLSKGGSISVAGNIRGQDGQELAQLSLIARGNLITEGELTGLYEYRYGGQSYYGDEEGCLYRWSDGELVVVEDAAGLELVPIMHLVRQMVRDEGSGYIVFLNSSEPYPVDSLGNRYYRKTLFSKEVYRVAVHPENHLFVFDAPGGLEYWRDAQGTIYAPMDAASGFYRVCDTAGNLFYEDKDGTVYERHIE